MVEGVRACVHMVSESCVLCLVLDCALVISADYTLLFDLFDCLFLPFEKLSVLK